MCIIDLDQPQPDIVNNIEQDEDTYIKLMTKDEGKEHMAEAHLDNIIQKLKARGAKKVSHLKDLGSHHMLQITPKVPPRSILTTKKTFHKKKLRFQELDKEEEATNKEKDKEDTDTDDDENDTDDEDTESEDESSTSDEDEEHTRKTKKTQMKEKTKEKEKEREKARIRRRRKSKVEEEKRTNSALRKRAKKKRKQK